MAHHYDVAILGTQPAGVLAAALLAKRGRRVLLVDHGESVLSYRRRGLRLPLTPTLVPTLERSPATKRVHEELGILPQWRTTATPLRTTFQAVLPQHRLDIRPAAEDVLSEVSLEFPELRDAVANFFERLFALDDEATRLLEERGPLAPDGPFKKLRARVGTSPPARLDAPLETNDLMAGIPLDHPLREVLLGPLTFFGHLDADNPSTLHGVRLMANYFRGAVDFADSVEGWPTFLRRVAEEAGVDYRRSAIVRRVEISRRRVSALELEDDRLPYRADFFVSNTLGNPRELMATADLHPRFALDQERARPVGGLFVVNLMVRPEVIPCGLHRIAFLLNGRRQQRDDEPKDPPLMLRHYSALDSAAARNGNGNGDSKSESETYEVLSVACPVRVADIQHSPERFSLLKEQILGRVRRVVPFLDDHLVDVSSASDTTAWDIESEPNVRRIDPWTLHPIYETPERPFLGVSVRSLRTYYKNLLHCGRDVVPGLGVEGDYITAWSVADDIQRLAGKAWKPR